MILMVGMPMIRRITEKATVHDSSSTVWPCTCLGIGAPGRSRNRQHTYRSPASTAMQITSVVHEISMKISSIHRPKSDRGRTVVIGLSQRLQPQELASTT